MKKFLSFVAAVVIAVSASAQSLPSASVKNAMSKALPTKLEKNSTVMKAPRKATQERTINSIPESAELQLFSADYYVSTMFGWGLYSGASAKAYVDGNDIYFEDLFHSAYYLPVKGTIQEDGNIVIKKQMVYEGIDYNGDGSEYDDLYFTLVEVDEDGNASFPDDDIILTKQEDGSYTLGSDVEFVYWGLCDQYGYYWALCANLVLTPFTPETPAVELPEGAETTMASYKHCYYNMADAQYTTVLMDKYVDGDVVYLNNICPDASAWVKGTVKDGKLHVPSGQFLGADATYLLTLRAGKDYVHEFEWIDEDNWEYSELNTYNPADELTFSNVDGAWVLDEGQCIIEEMSDETAFGVYFGEVIKDYAGDTPAVPADPTVLLEDYTSYIGQWVLSASIPAEDVDGNYIRPENMAVSVWEDGDILTFTADDGYYLSEDVTWMPYGFADEAGGYDLAFMSLTPAFYLYEQLFNEIGLQVSYTVDGVTNYSHIVYMDINGKVRVEPRAGEPQAAYAEGEGKAAVATRINPSVKTAFVNPHENPSIIKVYDSEGNVATTAVELTDDYSVEDYSCDKTIAILDKELAAGDYTIVFPKGTVVMGELANVQFNSEDIKVPFTVDASGAKRLIPNDATSISFTGADKAEGISYNITGQRVNSNFKGIVIKNGKKGLK